ncbi:flavodoxin family protein [Fusobacterium sp. PH5-44]|uniref:flavodoxin family protein n=1 Tax=unclassified Fusobacterium TaxID=2648384 RepID=UPI003D200943
MKMTVLYYSRTGNTKRMAETIVSGMNSVEEIEAKAFSINEIDAEWIKESKAVIMGSPIYMATICGDIKMWFEKEAMKYNLAGKIGGAFATAGYVHGGGELGIQSMLDHMLVFGMFAYSGGGSFGKPVIHLGPVAIHDNLDAYIETFTIYGKRIATKTKEVMR